MFEEVMIRRCDHCDEPSVDGCIVKPDGFGGFICELCEEQHEHDEQIDRNLFEDGLTLIVDPDGNIDE